MKNSELRVLADADLILEFFANRDKYIEEVETFINMMSPSSIVSVYITDKCLKRLYLENDDKNIAKEAVDYISGVLEGHIIEINQKIREEARKLDIVDLDSAQECVCASTYTIDAIITLNLQNFDGASIPVWSIKDYLIREKLNRTVTLSASGGGLGHLDLARPKTPLLGTDLALPKTPLFGTDGIQGRAGELLTAPLALNLGYWAGQVWKQMSPAPGPVIIGQDSRNSSELLAMAISAGLTSAGLEVWQLGLCPTPCVAYLVRETDAIGGIMISASHNPPEDNGIKFFNQQGLKLGKAEAQAIEAALRGHHPIITSSHTHWGKIQRDPSLVNRYGQFLLESLPAALHFEGLRVVLDLAWGASVGIAPEVFRVLGAEVICLHEFANGDRINVNCGSTHLGALREAVKEYDADLGFAFDGDADRVMAMDAQGETVDGDYILYLWGKTLKERQELPDDLIIGTVMANLAFERAWEKLGGRLLRTAVGDQHVQASMWETGAMLGGEQSGHIICHHHSYSGDGVQAALHLTALVKQSGLPLADLREESFHPYPYMLRDVRIEDRDRRLHWQDCDPLQQAIATAEAAMGDQGRVLVRASGTKPLIRVMVETKNAEDAEQWTTYLIQSVQRHLAA